MRGRGKEGLLIKKLRSGTLHSGTLHSGTLHSGTLRLGTRGSALALRQTERVIGLLRLAWHDLACQVCVIETTGDQDQTSSIEALYAKKGGGIFHSALEEALLAGEVDLVVASCKDIESNSSTDLAWSVVGTRADARDVLISSQYSLEQLPDRACLATSSPRRRGQLCCWRPDLSFVNMRGNVDTRVKQALATEKSTQEKSKQEKSKQEKSKQENSKQEKSKYDGVVLAAAGVHRLDLSARISSYIDFEVLLPAPAQGVLACQYRRDNASLPQLLAPLHNSELADCVLAERRVLTNLSGGCFAPVGVLARWKDDRPHLWARVASLDGKQVAAHKQVGKQAGSELGKQVGNELGKQGESCGQKASQQWQALADAVTEKLCQQGAEKILKEAIQTMTNVAENKS